MPEHLRALVVIIILASAAFTIARRSVIHLCSTDDYLRRRNAWIMLTLAAFFSYSFWVYTLIAIALLIVTQRKESNPLALFFLLLFLIPPGRAEIPGFGLINYFFALDHLRLLILCILVPASWHLRQQTGNLPFGRFFSDKLLASYLLLVAVLFLRQTTLTDTLRQTFYLFVDIFLPYYVASRSLRNLAKFRDALLSFVLAAIILSIIGTFEFSRHWLLYRALTETMGMNWGYGDYLGRSGILRASATTGQAIALGLVITVAIGFYLFLQKNIQNRFQRHFFALLLSTGLLAPLSRGPWVGAALMIVFFIATGQNAIKKLTILAVGGIFTLPLLFLIPGGQKLVNFLPFIGEVDKTNITYRQMLIDNSLTVINRNLWFGSIDYLQTPEMQAMRQGQGIIDIVNTYIAVTLEGGVVSLALFVSFFASVLLGIRHAMRTIENPNDETYLLGRSILATLIGILTIILTVSSITVIPIVYWSVAGLGVAYTQMIQASHLKV